MQVCQAAQILLRKYEGFSLTPYKDVAGLWTVGVGHRILFPGMKESYTAAECEAFFQLDLAKAAAAVSAVIEVPVTDNEFGALVSFVFNLGAAALKASTLLKLLNKGDKEGAANEFPRWNKTRVNGKTVAVSGLTARRQAEQRLFLS